MMVVSRPGVAPGDWLDGKYVLRACVGKGGMGSVFVAEQPALERQVAIKILHPELADCAVHAQRIRREAVAACRVRSRHCVSVIDCCLSPSVGWYLVMEYIPGRSLGRVLSEQRLPLPRIARLFDQVLSALGAVHAAGLVHGDVKSDNFLVDSVNRDNHVVMIDFGLARVPGSYAWLDLENDIVTVSGTPEYMAPEIVSGEPSMPSADLYAAGVLLYELLTGAPPFTGQTAAEVMYRQAHDPVALPSLRRPDRDIPPAIDQLVLRALDKRPDRRFPDTAAFARELRLAMAALRERPHRPEQLADGTHSTALAYPEGTMPERRFARGSTGADDALLEDPYDIEIGRYPSSDETMRVARPSEPSPRASLPVAPGAARPTRW